uniref:Uncharacterized protein n=1 Tax=Cercocebus atys TaxID=9531 RepID=A0A2K5LNR8_CERAT
MQLDGEACAEQKPRLDCALWRISCVLSSTRCSRFREYSCRRRIKNRLQILNLVSSSLSYGFTASFHAGLTLTSSCQRSLPWLSYLK